MLEMIMEIGNQTMDKKAVVGITDEFGRSLLMQAVVSNSVQTVEFLLKCGVDVDWGGTSYSNRTPLMQAACAGHLQLCKLLLDYGADVSLKDRFGRVVSEQAGMLGRQEVVRLLDSYVSSTLQDHVMNEDELVEVDSETQRLVWNSLVEEVSFAPATIRKYQKPLTIADPS
jgi:ankyrin repeat protein